MMRSIGPIRILYLVGVLLVALGMAGYGWPWGALAFVGGSLIVWASAELVIKGYTDDFW